MSLPRPFSMECSAVTASPCHNSSQDFTQGLQGDKKLQKIKLHENFFFNEEAHLFFLQFISILFWTLILILSQLLGWTEQPHSSRRCSIAVCKETFRTDYLQLHREPRKGSEIAPSSPTKVLRYSISTALGKKTELPVKIIPVIYLLSHQLKDRTFKAQLLQDIINKKQIKVR